MDREIDFKYSVDCKAPSVCSQGDDDDGISRCVTRG